MKQDSMGAFGSFRGEKNKEELDKKKGTVV